MLKKDFPGSILYFLANFSTSLTGSAPGDKIKNTGLTAEESLIVPSKISEKDNF